ncbi:DUF6412 domain-containing protein, partial [Kitasatospora sp. NPDC059571]|uniref:DUF6412 domain-containing protein n=1 Tax=Kitasatospora sp. NPDC059571 TaxID=3346871 RepID=UPI0036958843
MPVVALLLALVRLLSGDLLPAPGSLTAVAAAAALVLLAGAVAGTPVAARLLGARAPATVRDGVLRRQAFGTAFLPQHDPDARGRRRPRAPGAAPAAAPPRRRAATYRQPARPRPPPPPARAPDT